MFTEEMISGLDEEKQRVYHAIRAAARELKFSDETLRLRKLMKTDPSAAARVIMENEMKRYEKNIGPHRDVLFQQQKEAEDAAARPQKQAKRQHRVVASPPHMILKTSSVGEDDGS